MVQTAHGVVAQEVDLPDLLTHYILNEMAGAERRGRDWIDFVTKDLRDAPHFPAKTLSQREVRHYAWSGMRFTCSSQAVASASLGPGSPRAGRASLPSQPSGHWAHRSA